jgi:hypothetical protein
MASKGTTRPGLVERAFELASSGACHNLLEVELRLKEEGYSQVYEHLSGGGLRVQLRKRMSEASSPSR